MKIIYEGNDIVPWCTEVHIARTLIDMGHQVGFVPVGSMSTATLERLIDVERPDLFMLTQPWGSATATDRCILECCASLGIPTAGFHLDLFWGLPERERWVRDHTEPLFDCAHLFTPDGDHQAEFAAAGANHHFLPAGVFEPECYDAEPDPRWAGVKVGFVGSAPTARGGNYHDSDWPHRRALVARLADWYGDGFVHIGNGGTVPFLRGDDLNRFYASVPVIVGDSCFTAPERTYTSDRLWETWGRGGFLIHPWVPKIEHLIGHRLPSWGVGDWDHLHDVIEGYLGDAYARDGLREQIAATVRARHTYTNRMQTMLCTLGLASGVECLELAG